MEQTDKDPRRQPFRIFLQVWKNIQNPPKPWRCMRCPSLLRIGGEGLSGFVRFSQFWEFRTNLAYRTFCHSRRFPGLFQREGTNIPYRRFRGCSACFVGAMMAGCLCVLGVVPGLEQPFCFAPFYLTENVCQCGGCGCHCRRLQKG